MATWTVHAVCTLRVHPPTSPYPTFSAETEPISKDIAGSGIRRLNFHAGYIRLHPGKGEADVCVMKTESIVEWVVHLLPRVQTLSLHIMIAST